MHTAHGAERGALMVQQNFTNSCICKVSEKGHTLAGLCRRWQLARLLGGCMHHPGLDAWHILRCPVLAWLPLQHVQAFAFFLHMPKSQHHAKQGQLDEGTLGHRVLTPHAHRQKISLCPITVWRHHVHRGSLFITGLTWLLEPWMLQYRHCCELAASPHESAAATCGCRTERAEEV